MNIDTHIQHWASIINQEKLLNLLFESDDNPVVQNGERFHLEDCIEYDSKPGIIVAVIKSENGIQSLPVGAVDSFRFMNVIDEDAIVNQNKNNGMSYDQILKGYQSEKNAILEAWKKTNQLKYNQVQTKYGESLVGLDIVQNSKQIKHQDKDGDGVSDENSDNKEKAQSHQEKQDVKQIEEGLWTNIVDKFKSSASSIGKTLKNAYDDTRSGLKNACNSPFAQKGVKMLSKVVLGLNDDVDKKNIKMKCKYDGSSKNIKLMQIINVNNRKYMLCFPSENSDAMSLQDFQDIIVKNVKKSLTLEISGIVLYEGDIKDFLSDNEKSTDIENGTEDDKNFADADRESSINESKNITDETTYRPVSGIISNGNEIIIEFDRSIRQKRDDKNLKNIWK